MRRRINVNGQTFEVDIEPATPLLDVLRVHLGLTGTKEACGRGECGSCTVLVDGRPEPSCLLLAARVTAVETVEGLVEESRQFREALADNTGFQCGFCTPGHVVTATALARQGIPDDETLLRREISGNICRCTGYQAIIDSYRVMKEGGDSHDAG